MACQEHTKWFCSDFFNREQRGAALPCVVLNKPVAPTRWPSRPRSPLWECKERRGRSLVRSRVILSESAALSMKRERPRVRTRTTRESSARAEIESALPGSKEIEAEHHIMETCRCYIFPTSLPRQALHVARVHTRIRRESRANHLHTESIVR